MAKQDTKRTGFFDAAGNKLPSISTILGKFQDPGGLLHWAWKVGSEGRTLKEAREAQNTPGHVAAARALASVGGQPFVESKAPAELIAATDLPCRLFREWADSVHLLILGADVYAANHHLGYCGKVTAAMIEGTPWILSLKAGKGVYREDLLTAAACAGLWWPEAPPNQFGGAYFIRFGKDEGGFDECTCVEDLSPAFAMFSTLLTAYHQLDQVDALLRKGAA